MDAICKESVDTQFEKYLSVTVLVRPISVRCVNLDCKYCFITSESVIFCLESSVTHLPTMAGHILHSEQQT